MAKLVGRRRRLRCLDQAGFAERHTVPRGARDAGGPPEGGHYAGLDAGQMPDVHPNPAPLTGPDLDAGDKRSNNAEIAIEDDQIRLSAIRDPAKIA